MIHSALFLAAVMSLAVHAAHDDLRHLPQICLPNPAFHASILKKNHTSTAHHLWKRQDMDDAVVTPFTITDVLFDANIHHHQKSS